MFRRIRADQWDEMVKAYIGGAPSTSAAAMHGARPHSLRYQLHKRGIKLRSEHDDAYRARVDGMRFLNVDDEETAYWLGMMYTDGYVLRDRPYFGLALSAADADHVEKFARFMRYKGSIRIEQRVSGYPSANGCAVLKVGSRTIYNRLIALGVVPRKTWLLRPWVGPDHLLNHFWRGCLDGDGSLYFSNSKGHRNAHVNFVGTEAMVCGLSEYVRKLTGHPGHVHSHLATGVAAAKSGFRSFFVDWGGNMRCKEVAGIFYRDAAVSLERKHAVAIEMMEYTPTRKPEVQFTRTELIALLNTHGSFSAAARHLDIHKTVLCRRARRLGLTRTSGIAQ